MDASGVAVGVDGLQPTRLTSVGITHREPATVHRFELAAHNVSVADVPVDLDVTASDLRFAWATTPDDRLFVELQPPSQDRPVVGSARVSARHEDIEGAARAVLGAALKKKGFNLTALDIRLENHGPRAVSARASATVQKLVMRATVTLTADASIDDALVLSIRDAKLAGSNPVVDKLVAPFRPRLEALVARRGATLRRCCRQASRCPRISIAAGDEHVVVSAVLG